MALCFASTLADDGEQPKKPCLGSFPEEKPTCAVRCMPNTEVLCAGPKTGCGKLISFNNPCMLGGWNCNHKSHRK